MNKTKLIIIPVAAMLAASAFCGCTPPASDSAPVIEGIDEINCLVGQPLDLLDIVKATDAEDGDLTPALDISVGSEKVEDGYVAFNEPGKYFAALSVKDSAGNVTEETLPITVHSRDIYCDMRTTDKYAYGLSLSAKGGATATGDVAYGAYNVVATGGGEGSVSLSADFEVGKDTAGDVVYTVEADKKLSGTLTVNGSTTDVSIEKGEHDISVHYEAAAATLRTELGLSGADEFAVKIKKIEVRPNYDSYTERCGSDFVFEDGIITTGMDGGKMEYVRAAMAEDEKSCRVTIKPKSGADREPYYAKLFIHTGVALRAGRRYKISLTAAAEAAQSVNVMLNACNKEANASDTWEEMTGLAIGTSTQNHAYVRDLVPETDRGELVIQLMLGCVPSDKVRNVITVSGVSVREALGPRYDFARNNNFMSKFDAGSTGTMTYEGGKLIYKANNFSTTDWGNEISTRPFAVDKMDESYVVSFKARATNPVTMVFTMPTFGGWDPTLVWQRVKLDSTLREYRFLLSSKADKDDLHAYYVLMQFGSQVNSLLPATTVEISDFYIEYKPDFEKFGETNN